MNKRRRYLAKRRRADRAWATRIWQQLVRRGGLCPTCGNHPMNPLPTCPRCGWCGDPDRAGEECDVVFDNATRRPIPPAGRLTGDRSNLQSWIRRYFGDYQPAPWQVELMRDIVAGRRLAYVEARPAGRRFVRELLERVRAAERDQITGVDWASGPDLTVIVDERGDHVCQHGVAMDVHCCGCHNGFIFDRDHECSTFGQEPGYPVARAEADQEADQIEKPELDPD